MHRLRGLTTLIILCCWTLLSLIPVSAQDGLNLPTELYILLNEGVVERYGLGTVGVQRVTPDDAFILDFRVAPDGNTMAYRTQDGLYLYNMFVEGTQRRIEDSRASIPNIRGRGETIAWSPSSDALAYTTEYGGRVSFLAQQSFVDLPTPNLLNLRWSPDGAHLAAESLDGVWWIFRRDELNGMNLVSAIPGSNGGAWLTETEFIFTPPSGGITLLSLIDNSQTVVLDPLDRYHQPYVLEDGSIAIFFGEPNEALLQVLNIEGGAVTYQETLGNNPVDLNGVRWAPGGTLLAAFQGGALALVNPVSGSGFTLPISTTSAYSWGTPYPRRTSGVTLPIAGYFIALDSATGVKQVWRLSADGERPVTITPATMDITEFAIAPNNDEMVYVSNGILWQYTLGEEEATELVTLGTNQMITPAWSPDSNIIFYRDEPGNTGGIYRLDLSEGESTLFLADTTDFIYTRPKLASGTAAMLVKRGDELVLADTNTAEETPIGIVGEGVWRRGTSLLLDGQLIRGASAARGLFATDANRLSETPSLLLPLLPNLEIIDYVILQNETVRVLFQRGTPGEVLITDIPLNGSSPSVIANMGYMVNPLLTPDGTFVAGYTVPNGALIFYDVETDTRQMLDRPSQIESFRWQAR